MALSTVTFLRTRATVTTAGTSVAAGTAVPDNCHTIVWKNREASGGANILISQGTAGGTLADDGTSTVLEPGEGLTLTVGVLSNRVDDLSTLIYDASDNTTNVDIIYLCRSGAV